MIEEFITKKGICFEKFTFWAFGQCNSYLKEVPDLWNKLHPLYPIHGSDEIMDSLEKMTELYLKECNSSIESSDKEIPQV